MIRFRKRSVIAALITAIAVGCTSAPPEQSQQSSTETTIPTPDAQVLFQANCSSCHNPLRDATGPQLAGALGRWGNDTVRIKSFIRNSTKMIAGGDSYAVGLYNKWNKTAMYSFPNLTDAELDALLTLMK